MTYFTTLSQVYIISPKKQALSFECSSNDGEINIVSVSKVDDYEAHKKINRYERMGAGYTGPDFSTLDDVLNPCVLNCQNFNFRDCRPP